MFSFRHFHFSDTPRRGHVLQLEQKPCTFSKNKAIPFAAELQLQEQAGGEGACATAGCTGFQQTRTLMLPAFERPLRTPAAAATLSNSLHVKARQLGSASLQHLYAVVVAVAHDDAPLAVNCNAPGTVEQPIAATFAATKGSNVAAVAVS